MTGQSTGADGSRRSARRCSQMPSGISSRPKTNSAGTAMKITSPAYGLVNIPSRSAATSVRNATALTVAMTTPASATGWRSGTRSVIDGLLQAGHVGDERVDVGRRQLRIAVGHRRLLGRLGLRLHLLRRDDPRADFGGAELLADAVERIGSCCPRRRWRGTSNTSARRTRPCPSRRRPGPWPDAPSTTANTAAIINTRNTIRTVNLQSRMADVELPEVEQAHHRRMRRVGPIDVPRTSELGCTMPSTTLGSIAKS